MSRQIKVGRAWSRLNLLGRDAGHLLAVGTILALGALTAWPALASVAVAWAFVASLLALVRVVAG